MLDNKGFFLYIITHLLIIYKVEERRCTRRRVPSSFSRGRDTAALRSRLAGGKKRTSTLPCGRRTDALYASVRETNRRPFGARYGDDLLWIILDNHPPLCEKF
ncbi:hypothetical protein HMPREF0083_05517 [Aneurinibacillus aneurinilyticus ATCC 12856]|uniref:Uncharacterized protein n=1 Tax=Aneurinibacillus aneurinilyticus ATCC 12856 TaxID=649747 RepID=U1WTG0_ANEAE|nr:hypothetical protein HMPREF0083_05517 [Aneurinibacillus aneurinilyticus ATCC 12856]